MFILNGIFWGILVMAIGILIIVNQVFKLKLPVARISFGIFLIMLGINFFMTDHSCVHIRNKAGNTAVFQSKKLNYNPSVSKYEAVFSDATLDLSGLKQMPGHEIKLSCVFGSMDVKVPPNTNLVLDSDVAFGNIENRVAEKNVAKTDSNTLKINAEAVFGQIKITSD